MSSPEERRSLLHSWQRYYGMEPRNDSRLTRMYVNGEIIDTPDAVARELMATDFIYKTTLYGEVIEQFLRGLAERLRNEYRLTWTETWEIVQFYGPIGLKLLMAMRCQAVIPEQM